MTVGKSRFSRETQRRVGCFHMASYSLVVVFSLFIFTTEDWASEEQA